MKKYYLLVVTLFISFFANAQTYNNEWIDYSKTYYKFNVGSNGLYRINQPVLSAAGLGAIDAQHFQLWRNGVEVPIYTSVSTGSFSPSDYIEFYGLMNDGVADTKLYPYDSLQMSNKWSLYTDTAAYFLTVNTSASNKRIVDGMNDVAGNLLSPAPYFMHKINRYFKNKMNEGFGYDLGELVTSASYETAEGWTSNDIYAGQKLTENNPTIRLYNSGPTASLTAVVAGNTYTSRTSTIKINGTTVATSTISGYNIKRYSVTGIALSTFTSDAANIEFSNASPTTTDRLVVSNYSITYPRIFNFGGASLFEFELASNLDGYYLEIANFSSGAGVPVLYDLTNNIRYTAVLNSGFVKFALPASVENRNFVLLSTDVTKVLSVNALSSRNFINYSLPENQGDYLIITHPLLFNINNGIDHIDEYKSYRSSVAGGSFNTNIIDINQLIDQFAFGIKHHPLSIRNFSTFSLANFSTIPKYFFLIGKGLNYAEFKGHESDPNVNKLALVPVFGHPASDNLLTATRTTNYPQIAIGRLSAITVNEVGVYLEKVKQYELAQTSNNQTISNKAWMKNVAQVTGGLDDPGLAGLITSYMQGYEEIASDSLFGGKVYNFSGNSGSNKAIGSDKTMEGLIKEGASLITYFGHSSPNTIEFNLDNPENYDNTGKYPVIIINGCLSGDLFQFDTLRAISKGTLSEKFIFANQKGSIAYIASTHFGLPTQLNYFNSAFYRNFSKDMYGQSIGNILKATMQSMSTNYYNDYIAQTHAEEITLHGDPAIKMNSHSKPDYVIEDSLVSFSPDFITVADNNVSIKAKVMNVGKAVSDSVKIKMVHTLPNNSQVTIFNSKIQAVKNTDSITVNLPLNPLLHKGVNQITVIIDPDESIDELSETNNTFTKSFTVLENEIRPIFPYEFSIINDSTPILFASTANPTADSLTYFVEIDTTANFNSPSKINNQVITSGGIVEFAPSIILSDSTVYYWRVAVGEVIDENTHWNNSSFIYIKDNDGGFNQSHYYQYKKNDYTAISIDSASRKFKFNEKNSKLLARVGTYPYYSWDQNNVNLDDIQVDAWGCTFNSLQFYVFDSTTLNAWENINVGSFGRFGSFPVCTAPRKFFDFPLGQQAYRRKAMDFFDSIPTGSMVLIRNLLNLSNTSFVSTWKADTTVFGSGKSLWHKFHEFGLTEIDSFTKNAPFLFVFKKGDTLNFPVKQEVASDVNTQLVKSYFLTGKESFGKVSTPWMGPAKEWKNFLWDQTGTTPTNERRFDIFGKDSYGNEILLAENYDSKDTSIAFINAGIFPYLRMVMNNYDPYQASPTQLKYWRLTAATVPEGAISPNIEYGFQEQLTENDTLHFKIAFKNVSTSDFDSLKVRLIITDNGGVQHIYNNLQNGERLTNLVAGDTVIISYSIPMKNYIGKNQFYLEVNPDEDQLEQFFFNNVFYKSFSVSSPIPCPNGEAVFYSGSTNINNVYQWQESTDEGNNFIDLSNAGIYSGIDSDTLKLTNTPSNLYGNKYRCKITNNELVTYSGVFTLRFLLYWTGAVSTEWENPLNWSCNVIPDQYTDVIINTGLINYPVINSNASCRSIKAMPGSTVSINSGFNLEISGLSVNY